MTATQRPADARQAMNDGWCPLRVERMHCDHWFDGVGPCCTCEWDGGLIEAGGFVDGGQLTDQSPAMGVIIPLRTAGRPVLRSSVRWFTGLKNRIPGES